MYSEFSLVFRLLSGLGIVFEVGFRVLGLGFRVLGSDACLLFWMLACCFFEGRLWRLFVSNSLDRALCSSSGFEFWV